MPEIESFGAQRDSVEHNQTITFLSLIDAGRGTSESEQGKAFAFLRDLSNTDLLDIEDALVAERGPAVNLALIMTLNEITRRRRAGLFDRIQESTSAVPMARFEDADSAVDVQGTVIPGALNEFDKPEDEAM